MGILPLQGTRVLDLGTYIAAPIATQTMADLGAEVIKIESPQADFLREIGGPLAPLREGAEHDRHYNRRPWFNELNRGKFGMVLDLTNPAGVEAFKDLVQISDVVIENYSPRVMENFGLQYPALRQVRADIIMVSVSAFGATGPQRYRMGFGPNIDAASGLTYLTGYANGPPIKPGNYFSDFFAGLHAGFATLAALNHRRRTGRGQHIDLSMREVDTMILGDALMDVAMNERVQTRIGNGHPSMAPHGCYRCQGNDQWVTIAVGADEEWRRLVKTMGSPKWADSPFFSTKVKRWENRDELDSYVSEWTRGQDRDEVMASLQRAGIAAGAVHDIEEIVDNPQIRHRGYFSLVEHPEIGPAPIRNLPWTLSSTPVSVQAPSPTFAQQNDLVFRELLGFNSQAIETLYSERATTAVPLQPKQA